MFLSVATRIPTTARELLFLEGALDIASGSLLLVYLHEEPFEVQE